MTTKRFRRTSWHIKIKLGKRNKKKQKWRRARGRHNKIREKKKGKARKVEIGYRNPAKTRDLIFGKKPVYISNMNDAEKVEKNSAVIIASLGKKKRIEIEKKLNEKNCKIINELRGTQHESKN